MNNAFHKTGDTKRHESHVKVSRKCSERKPKFNEDTPMMREHCRHVTGLESTFAKIEQLSGSIAKRNVRHPSPILISQGYFNNISAKEPRMNLFGRNKFEMRASIFFKLSFKGTLFTEIKFSNHELLLGILSNLSQIIKTQ